MTRLLRNSVSRSVCYFLATITYIMYFHIDGESVIRYRVIGYNSLSQIQTSRASACRMIPKCVSTIWRYSVYQSHGVRLKQASNKNRFNKHYHFMSSSSIEQRPQLACRLYRRCSAFVRTSSRSVRRSPYRISASRPERRLPSE